MSSYFKQYLGKTALFIGLFSIIFTFSLYLNPNKAFAVETLLYSQDNINQGSSYAPNSYSGKNANATDKVGSCFTPSSTYSDVNKIQVKLYYEEYSATDWVGQPFRVAVYQGTGPCSSSLDDLDTTTLIAQSPTVNIQSTWDSTQYDTYRDFPIYSGVDLVSGNTYYIMIEYLGTYENLSTRAISFYSTSNNGGQNYGVFSNDNNVLDYRSAGLTMRLYNDTDIVEPPPDDTTTRIVSFSPAQGATTTSPVDFELQVYVNEADLGSIIGVKASLHNIDQNVLALGQWFSPSDIYLFEDDIETAGLFTFSTTTPIGDGNYRLEACIERSYFSGWFANPFSPINDCQSHQFTVGEATFIGNLTQTIYGQMDQFYQEIDYGSSTVSYLSSTCNPLGDFDIRLCATFLLIPDSQAMASTTKNIRDGILTRFPIGYVTRFVEIISNPATSSLPSFTANIMIGPAASTSLTFDIDDTLQGGADLINSITDPFHGKGFREVTEPFIQFVIYGLVIITIIFDLSHGRGGGGRHSHRDI